MTDKVLAFQQKEFAQKQHTDLRPGWIVKVYQRIKEGNKERTQAFEGIIVSRKHGSEPGATITVRTVSGGIGVEKIFPLALPTITKIDVVRKSKVRRAKLYYLREKSQREIRRKTKLEVPKTNLSTPESSE